MTIAEQAKWIADALQAWAESNGGSAHVAGDVVASIELLRARPGAPKAVVLFSSEDVRGEISELGMVDRVFRVVIARGRGFRLDTGESLTDGVAGGKPLFELVEEAREMVRGLRFDELTTDGKADYRGTKSFEVQGIVLDAYELTFAIGTQIPQQTDTKDTEDEDA